MSRIIIRQKIIADCAILFNQKGYNGVSISEIEKVTGKTKAVIYGYFVTKNDLAKAVLEYNINRKLELIREQILLRTDNISKLQVHFDVHDPENHFLLTGGCPLLNAAIETDNTNQELHQIVAKALLLWKQDILDLINNGIQAGEFKSGIVAGDLAWLLISLVEGVIFINQTTQNKKLTRQLLYQAKLIFFRHLSV